MARSIYYLALISFGLLVSNFFPPSANAQDAGALQRELQLQLERSEPLPRCQL